MSNYPPGVTGNKVERTGRVFSFAGSEFSVIFSDGCQQTIWSPPWHQMSKDEEMAEAIHVSTQMDEYPHIIPVVKP